MSDVVNEYFHRFYPKNLDDSEFRMSGMLDGMSEFIHRPTSRTETIFPEMVMADGFRMSVQGHLGAYSSPRSDFAARYTAVEVGYPSEAEELLMPYVEDATAPTDTVYGYVPVEVVEAVIAKHGGLVAASE